MSQTNISTKSCPLGFEDQVTKERCDFVSKGKLLIHSTMVEVYGRTRTLSKSKTIDRREKGEEE